MKVYRSAVEADGTEVKTGEIAKGLRIRKFNGEIDKTPEEKDKAKKTILKFVYERVVFPWSRTGKDFEDKDVLGAVPTLSEVLAYCNASGFSTEFELDKEGQPTKPSVVSFVVDGLNSYFSSTARAKAQNTPETAKSDAVRLYAKRMGISVVDAEKQLADMFK